LSSRMDGYEEDDVWVYYKEMELKSRHEKETVSFIARLRRYSIIAGTYAPVFEASQPMPASRARDPSLTAAGIRLVPRFRQAG